jgi:tetratricopeptide (TPR) repeat protein
VEYSKKYSNQEIRKRRIDLGLSLEEASTGICSISYLSLIENKGRVPNAKKYNQLIERLFGESTTENSLTPSPDFLISEASIKNSKSDFNLEKFSLSVEEQSYLEGLRLELASETDAAITRAFATLAFENLPDWLNPRIQLSLCRLYRSIGDLFSCFRHGEEGLKILGLNPYIDVDLEFEIRGTLSNACLDIGDLKKAAEYLEGTPGRDLLTPWNRVVYFWSTAMLLSEKGEAKLSAKNAELALSELSALDRPITIARLTNNAVWLKLQSGDLDVNEARISLSQTAKIMADANLPADLAQVHSTLADLELFAGNSNGANEMAIQAVEMARGLREHLVAAKIFIAAAEVLKATGSSYNISALLGETLLKLEASHANPTTAKVWKALGELYEELGELGMALTCYKASVDYAIRVSSEPSRVQR